MSDLKPNQALFLWRMITGATPEVREPMKSKARPDLKKDRQRLLDEGYMKAEKRGRGEHFVLTDKAWNWAASGFDVKLSKAASGVGAEALEGLLHHLLPFLQQNNIPLANLFMSSGVNDFASTAEPTDEAVSSPNSTLAPTDLTAAVERAYLLLSQGKRKVRVMLRDLRPRLPETPRDQLDATLRDMQRAGKLVLYREDNTAALTPADHSAALMVGDAPRHLVYLED